MSTYGYGRMAGRRHAKGKPFKLFSDQLPTVEFNKMYLDEQHIKHTYEVHNISTTRGQQRGPDTDNFSLPSPRRPDWDEFSISDYSRARSESPTHPLSPNLAHLRRNIRKRFGIVGKHVGDDSDPLSPHYFERRTEKRNSLIGVAPFAASPRAMELVSGVKPSGRHAHNLRRITTPILSSTGSQADSGDLRRHGAVRKPKDDAISILKNQIRRGVETHFQGRAVKEAKKEVARSELSQSPKVMKGRAEHVSTGFIERNEGTHTSSEVTRRTHNVEERIINKEKRKEHPANVCKVKPLSVESENNDDKCVHNDQSTGKTKSEKIENSPHMKLDSAINSYISTRGILKIAAATNVLLDKIKNQKQTIENDADMSQNDTIDVTTEHDIVDKKAKETEVQVSVDVVTPLSQINDILNNRKPTSKSKDETKRRRVNFHEINSKPQSNANDDTTLNSGIIQNIQIPDKITITDDINATENAITAPNKDGRKGRNKHHNKINSVQSKSYLPRLAVIPAIKREHERETHTPLCSRWKPVKCLAPQPQFVSPESIPADSVIAVGSTRDCTSPTSEENSRCSYRKYAVHVPALDHSDYAEPENKTISEVADDVPELDYIAQVIDVFEEFERNQEDGFDGIDRSMNGEELLKAYRLWDRKRRTFPTGYRTIEPPQEREALNISKQFGYAKPYKINNDVINNKDVEAPAPVTL